MLFNPFSGMNFSMHSPNPFAEYMKSMFGTHMHHGTHNPMMHNPMMQFCQHMMNCCCNMMDSSCDKNSSCSTNSSCDKNGSCNTNTSYNTNNSCDRGYCGSGSYDSFNLYPMMMKNCMKIMAKTLRMSDKMSGSCYSSSCDWNKNSCDMGSWIKKLENCSNSWSENFGKLHGEMMTFNEQAMEYIKLIDENIKVMKEQAEKSKE